LTKKGFRAEGSKAQGNEYHLLYHKVFCPYLFYEKHSARRMCPYFNLYFYLWGVLLPYQPLQRKFPAHGEKLLCLVPSALPKQLCCLIASLKGIQV
jgi:hypothetical protein